MLTHFIIEKPKLLGRAEAVTFWRSDHHVERIHGGEADWAHMDMFGSAQKSIPCLCACGSSDTGQWLQSRSSWCSREGWRGQNKMNLPDMRHTWRQQHSSANKTAAILRELIKKKANGKCFSQQFDELKSPCRDTFPCQGGTHQMWLLLYYRHKARSWGSDNNPEHSDRTAGLQ